MTFWLSDLRSPMGSLFDRFAKFNKIQGGTHEVIIQREAVSAESPPATSDPLIIVHEPVKEIKPPVDSDQEDYSEEVKSRIRVLLEKEQHLRNQREKYRMKYYTLEAMQASKEAFAENYAIIKDLTEQLAPIYLERKKIEATGEIKEVKKLGAEEELKIDSLKLKKTRLIDKKSKLEKKVKGYLGYAKGEQLLNVWTAKLEETKLEIYEIDQQIEQIRV